MGRLTEIYRVARCEPWEQDTDVSYHRTREGADRRVREHKARIVAGIREGLTGVTVNTPDEWLYTNFGEDELYGTVMLTAVTLED